MISGINAVILTMKEADAICDVVKRGGLVALRNLNVSEECVDALANLQGAVRDYGRLMDQINHIED